MPDPDPNALTDILKDASPSHTDRAGDRAMGLRGMNAPELRPAKGLPPVHLWNPPFCGKIDMVIRRDGHWDYMGTPINRPAMVRLFSTILRREPDGSYVLVTPVERVGIEVEDAPFIAVGVESTTGDQGPALTFATNVGDFVTAGPDHAILVRPDPSGLGPIPYIHVRAGLDARIARSVFYDLVNMGHEQDGHWGIESQGQFFSLGPIHD
jgi:hypothetical protein